MSFSRICSVSVGCSRMSNSATFAPSSAHATAMARPSPRPPPMETSQSFFRAIILGRCLNLPVTTAVLPMRLIRSCTDLDLYLSVSATNRSMVASRLLLVRSLAWLLHEIGDHTRIYPRHTDSIIIYPTDNRRSSVGFFPGDGPRVGYRALRDSPRPSAPTVVRPLPPIRATPHGDKTRPRRRNLLI